MASVPIREEWAGRVVEGKFHLLQRLGGSERHGAFLAMWQQAPLEPVVIHLMPAEAAEAEGRVAVWTIAQELDCRELLDVYGHGFCEMDGAEFAYVVTEFAPEVLAEVLRERALTAHEARVVLEPLVDALKYLHGKGLVHGHVKPTNILANGDELKLTVDDVMRAGVAEKGFVQGPYVAPEFERGVVTPAGDIWSLGVTLVKMLTQKFPEVGADGKPAAPEGFPEPFARIARGCLRMDPAERCGLEEIRAWLSMETAEEAPGSEVAAAMPEKAEPEARFGEPVTPARRMPELETPERVTPERAAGPGESQKSFGMGSQIKLLIAVVVVVMALIGFRMWMTQRGSAAPERPDEAARSAQSTQATSTTQAAPSESVPAKPAAPPVMVRGAVAERVPAEVLQSALATIRGTLVVEVRVTVGPNGRVADAAFADHGPSRYFANASLKAARQWRFRPATANGRAVNSRWLLHFAYTTEGDDVTATEVSP